jgi:hypothetical protein
LGGPSTPLPLFELEVPGLIRTGHSGSGPHRHEKRAALATEEPDDDTLFDLIGAVGAGINASKDERLPLDVRELAADLAENTTDKLDQFRKTA